MEIHPDAFVSPDAKIFPSVRGTRIVVGAGARIEPFAMIRCVGGSGDVTIGERSIVNPFCVLYSGNGIRIGHDVLIAPSVQIVPTNHEFGRRDIPIREQRFRASKGGVVIEDDVWIGAGAILLDGAHVERGAIIGAGAVVSRRIPSYEIWAGNPSRRVGVRP